MPASTLEKSSCKLWPQMKKVQSETEAVPDKSGDNQQIMKAVISDEEQDLDTRTIFRDLQTLQPEIEACDVSEWVATAEVDYTTEEELTDEKIIETKDDVDDEDVEPTTRLSHTEAKNVFDLALQYIEQRPVSTPMDILWIRKWRNIAVKSRLWSAKQ
ncbi:hypothetical protein J6590_057745 [Homalodisca vitripennis]|nr:hypothetical protein J6590_057745 [Homalodisca vitripennis]